MHFTEGAAALKKDGKEDDKRGGARKRDVEAQKKEINGKWWHDDALPQLAVKIEGSKAKHTKVSSLLLLFTLCQLSVPCLLLCLSTASHYILWYT